MRFLWNLTSKSSAKSAASASQTIDYMLGEMILPQLEADCHRVDVAGMFFFHDNTFVLREGDPLGERLVDVDHIITL